MTRINKIFPIVKLAGKFISEVYSWVAAERALLVAMSSVVSKAPLLFTSINTFTILVFVVASAVLTFTVMGKVI